MSHNQRIQLQTIADIRMGYPFRQAIERDPLGTIGLIQMKDFTEFNRLDFTDIYRVALDEEDADRHLLRHNDILFRSRGVTNHAAIVPPNVQDCIASPHLTVLHICSEQVDPGYVAWYLNHPQAQERLRRSAEGTSLMMINKKAIGEFEIEVPPLEKQRKIAALGEYGQQEQELLAKLAERRKLLMDHVLIQQVQG
jgi:restriction endonuclease S subunit